MGVNGVAGLFRDFEFFPLREVFQVDDFREVGEFFVVTPVEVFKV